jgi:hypothetical protein
MLKMDPDSHQDDGAAYAGTALGGSTGGSA